MHACFSLQNHWILTIYIYMIHLLCNGIEFLLLTSGVGMSGKYLYTKLYSCQVKLVIYLVQCFQQKTNTRLKRYCFIGTNFVGMYLRPYYSEKTDPTSTFRSDVSRLPQHVATGSCETFQVCSTKLRQLTVKVNDNTGHFGLCRLHSQVGKSE